MVTVIRMATGAGTIGTGAMYASIYFPSTSFSPTGSSRRMTGMIGKIK